MLMSNTNSAVSASTSSLLALLPGLVIAGALAALATWAAGLPTIARLGLSPLILAILVGMVLGNTAYPRLSSDADAGVNFAKSTLLRAGIVLYGFRVTFQQIAGLGWSGFLIDLAIVVATFLLGAVLGTRLFKLDRGTSMLIGAGSAICGAAAVMATQSVLRSPPHQVAVAIATVVVFGTLAMFVYPLLQAWLQLPDEVFGVYVGSTVHEVAQVVAVGNTISADAAATAVIVKMLRVMLLVTFLLILGGFARWLAPQAGRQGPIAIPWFALLFVAASAVHSAQLLPAEVVTELIRIDDILLATAMAALGLHTRAAALRQAGIRPLLLAGVLFVFLRVGGYATNRGVAAPGATRESRRSPPLGSTQDRRQGRLRTSWPPAAFSSHSFPAAGCVRRRRDSRRPAPAARFSARPASAW